VKAKERWTPSGVIGIAVFSLLGLAMVWLAVTAASAELWGEPLFETVGVARPRPVWMAWIAVVVLFGAGVTFFVTGVGYLYRVARGRVPRVQPTKKASRRGSSRSGSNHSGSNHSER